MSTDDATVTSSPEAKPKAAKARKAKAADRPAGKRSLNLSLTHEDYRRLATHALAEDCTISDIVSRLARAHLREFHLARTPGAKSEA